MKINISINDDLLARVDKYVDQNYTTRSGVIAFALSQYLASQEVFGLLRSMNIAMQRIADQGTVDEETYKELEKLQAVCKALVNE